MKQSTPSALDGNLKKQTPERVKRTIRLNSVVTEIPNSSAFLVNEKYIVERKTTEQAISSPLDGSSLRKSSSSGGSNSSLPRPQKRPPVFRRRSNSHDESRRPRVRINDPNWSGSGSDGGIEPDEDYKHAPKRNHHTICAGHHHHHHHRHHYNPNISHNWTRRLGTRRRFQVNRAVSPDVPSSQNSMDNLNSDLALGPVREDVVPTQRRFEKSFYWFSMHRKKFGFRYIVLCLIALLYTLFGATVFYFIEGTNERFILRAREQSLDQHLDRLSLILSGMVNHPNTTIEIPDMKDFIKKAYIDLQKVEAQYKWSTYYRLEDPDNNMKWSFASAFFFSMNVYTTTGYGSISAETFSGQLFTMIYAFLFVPVTLVILRDLGQMFLVNFTKLYAHGLTLVRRIRGFTDIDEDEMIQLPIKYCMGILTIYLLLCTTVVYLYDALMGPDWEDGLSYFTAFYFSFISLTTIGLGDVMPNNVPYAPPISIIFFLGMAVIKVVNRSTYIAVENGVFGCMTMVESKIDKMFAGRNDQSQQSIEDRPCDDAESDTTSIDEEVERRRDELVNNFTVRSISTFMQSNQDVYGGGFGRVTLRRGDLIHGNNNNQNTVNSRAFRHHTVHAFNRLKKQEGLK